MNTRLLRLSRQLYAFLLRLYPQRYRDEFGEEMTYVFSESLQDAYAENGQAGVLDVWVRTGVDTGKSVAVEFLEGQKGDRAMNTQMSVGTILRLSAIVGALLLIPLFGNTYVEGWNWSPFDFVFMGILLFGTGLAYELVAKRSATNAYRLATGVALAAALLLVWVNAAVGIIGDDNPANLLYLFVPLIGIAGAVNGRFRPAGMARALFVTALAQALVPVVALILWSPQTVSWSPGVVPVFGLNTIFVVLFAGAALLFRHAGVIRLRRSR